MGHVYASVAQLNDYLRDAGSSAYATESASIVARKLGILEAVSRSIDGHCRRSDFGSGFGPRLGTNRYSGDGSRTLRLNDDLLSITSLTVKPAFGASGTAYTEETDFVALPFDSTPKRRLVVHTAGAGFVFPYGLRTVELAGTFGERDQRRNASATLGEALDASETGIDVSDGDEFSPGLTILVDDEQLYVRSISTNTLTVSRGANGTTAATHDSGAAIDIYEYAAEVTDACLAASHRRLKARDAGGDGSDGGGEIPPQRQQSEASILFPRLRAFRFELVR